jgi:hypothetical protein
LRKDILARVFNADRVEHEFLFVFPDLDEFGGLLPGGGRAAVRDKKYPRSIVGNASGSVGILAAAKHLDASLDRLSHGRVAAGMKLGREEVVRGREIQFFLDRPEADDRDLDATGGEAIGAKSRKAIPYFLQAFPSGRKDL